MDSRICQTSTASPAEPGELSYLFSLPQQFMFNRCSPCAVILLKGDKTGSIKTMRSQWCTGQILIGDNRTEFTTNGEIVDPDSIGSRSNICIKADKGNRTFYTLREKLSLIRKIN